MREAGVKLVTRRRLLLGLAGAAPRAVRVRLARPGARPARASTASRSTWPPPPPRRRPGSRTPTRSHCRSTPTAGASGYGSRQAYCPSSPAYRDRRRAARQRPRPPVRRATPRWRCGTSTTSTAATSPGATATCPPPRSGTGFAAATATSTGSTTAWGTAFWSQRYTAWDQVLPPRATPTFANPTQALDFARFSSDELLDCFRAERDILHAHDPRRPGHHELHGRHVLEPRLLGLGTRTRHRVHRPLPARRARRPGGRPVVRRRPDPVARRRAALAADGALHERRQLAAPQPRQAARPAAPQLARPTWRGAATARCSSSGARPGAGAEKFHSAMVPHAGTDTKVWREVVGLGARPRRTGRGRRQRGRAARRRDCCSTGRACGPARCPRTRASRSTRSGQLKAWHAAAAPGRRHRRRRAPRRRPVRIPAGPRAVAVPGRRRERRQPATGTSPTAARLVVGPFSGVVDEHDHVGWRLPGLLRDLLGVRVEEFFPLPAARHRRPRRRRHRPGLVASSATSTAPPPRSATRPTRPGTRMARWPARRR